MIENHRHDGLDSEKIKPYNVIPTFVMTTAELAAYLARPAIEGEEFNVYDGTSYYKYVRINGNWVDTSGSYKVVIGTQQAPASTSSVVITTGFRPKLIEMSTAGTIGSYSGASWATATTTSDAMVTYMYPNGSTNVFGTTSSFVVLGPFTTAGESKCAANISAIGDTSFTLYFSDVTARPYYQWKVIG